MNGKHTVSALLTYAGILMISAGILVSVCARFSYGGIFCAAASCMFFAAYNFRLTENGRNEAEDTNDE